MRDELLEIRGIGEAKADEIMAIVDAHGGDDERVDRAIEALEVGRAERALEILRGD